ncbi:MULTISPECIES: DUF6089 family protein [unclassified Carboxylicivirga]|uniref:OmpA family protein n=1 Tax=Carboxylicivirga TaxID=1628153 RepID=UPI003D331A04
MKRLRNIALSTAVLLAITNIVNAQFASDHRNLEEYQRYSRDKVFNTWSLAIGYGPLVMQNDLTSYAVFPDRHWTFGPMVKLSKQIHPAWAFDFQLISSDFHSGNETFYSAGNLYDYSINAVTYINQWFAYPGPMRDRWNVFLKIGAGLTAYRTRVHYTDNDAVVHYRDWAPRNAEAGYLVLGYDAHKPDRKVGRVSELLIPMTLGLQYRINRNFDIGFETSMRWSIEDKLDNVLSGADNDKYWYTNIHLAYKLGKKNKRHARWTHRGYGFNVFGKPKKDPLADEVAMLEQQLQDYASTRVIKTDSITIRHHALRIYGSNHMVSVYFNAANNKLDTRDHIELATIALYMTKHPNARVDIYGYNDHLEDATENLAISQKRCEEVLSYFVDDLGINRERFHLYPKGEDDLLIQKRKGKNKTLDIINRRADVVVIEP